MSRLEKPQEWAQKHFGDVEMGDVRRVDRVVAIAQAMAREPGASIPQMFEEPYAVKAAYQLFSRPEATPDRLQAAHRALVQERLRQAGTYLLLEDTSELSWGHCQPRQGLGPLGSNSEYYQGVHLHSVLAVQWPAAPAPAAPAPAAPAPAAPAPAAPENRRPTVEIIGLCDQQFHIRQRRPEDEPNEASCARKKRPRESQLWEQATGRIGLKPQAAAVRWVRVCDRGADIYEHLQACQRAEHGFVIRASQDRALVAGAGGGLGGLGGLGGWTPLCHGPSRAWAGRVLLGVARSGPARGAHGPVEGERLPCGLACTSTPGSGCRKPPAPCLQRGSGLGGGGGGTPWGPQGPLGQSPWSGCSCAMRP